MQSDFLGLILVAQGAISRDQLYAGLRRQSQTGEMLGEALVQLGALSSTALEKGLAVQIGAPQFAPEWIAEEVESSVVDVPNGLDVRLIYRQERLEIWGVRTPAGRTWLEERAAEFDGDLGMYVLPDRAWKATTAQDPVGDAEIGVDDDAQEALSPHVAIEKFYEAGDLTGLCSAMGRGLHDMFALVSVALWEPEGLHLCWQSPGGLSLDEFESGEPVIGWQIDDASSKLIEGLAKHGWRLSFGGENGLVTVIYALDNEIDDPIVFQDLTSEFESAYKLLMERVISG